MRKPRPNYQARNFDGKFKRRDNNKPKGVTFDQMMRKFKKYVERSGLLQELKKREFYEKPTAKRKRKLKEGVLRQQKRERLEHANLFKGRNPYARRRR